MPSLSFHPNIVDTIGNTPLIRLSRITAGLPAAIGLKAEFKNPLGSVKDRIGRAMIEAAEVSGELKREPDLQEGSHSPWPVTTSPPY